MKTVTKSSMALTAIAVTALMGCSMFTSPSPVSSQDGADTSYYQTMATRVEYPESETPISLETTSTAPPVTIDTAQTLDYWDVHVEEIIQMGLQQSKIMRDLGGLVLRSPDSVRTAQDPAIRETDPRFGVDAALGAFDTTFSSSLTAEKNDRALNNIFLGGGTNMLQQDASVLRTEISKRTAVGTEFTLRNNTDYDANNAPANQFPSVWNTNVEAEFRHPLLQGGGLDFNRIAGPSEIPGVTNGVLIARMNTDVSLADFELGVRNFVSDLENAYWDLYFAYRDLDAKTRARDSALETWRRIHSLYETGRRGGEAEKEAQAREQYFRLYEEVQNALTGRLLEGTRTNNGSSGGTFRATSGVYVSERRLRLMMGLPISDGRLIRPADEPPVQKVTLDWDSVLLEALTQRVELRRQKWLVKRREMELEANERFLQPRLDAIGRYRWRGFGKDLFPRANTDLGQFDNAVQNMTNGDFQEWQLGLELSFPIGHRRAHAAVRHAELVLARERSILKEQERSVVHDLSNAVAEMDRAYAVVQTSYNRRLAARQQLASVQAAYEADQAPFSLVLEAQRRFADAESHYYRMLVEYALAIKNVHFEKGSLLEYCSVYLSEGAWPVKAYEDAAERGSLRRRPPCVDDLRSVVRDRRDREQVPFSNDFGYSTTVNRCAANAAPDPNYDRAGGGQNERHVRQAAPVQQIQRVSGATVSSPSQTHAFTRAVELGVPEFEAPASSVAPTEWKQSGPAASSPAPSGSLGFGHSFGPSSRP